MGACAQPGCRAYAMRGERWCRSHHPTLPHAGGAPEGNQNARTHGLYARWFSADEQSLLRDVAGVAGLDGEIAAIRVAIARLLADTGAAPVHQADALGRAVDALGRALKVQRVLDGERASSLMDAIEGVLAELGIDAE